jgi:ATP-dependent DNA ligase
MNRYFPELLEPLQEQLPERCAPDGELVIAGDGALDFEALLLRIHPAASRVEMLSAELPAELVAFDLLAHEGEDLRPVPFQERRERLHQVAAGLEHPWHLTPSTDDVEVAARWFDEFEAAGCDGIVAKRLEQRYVEGKREMVKVKHRRSVDVVVGGYRVHKDGDKIGSLLLGLYNDEGQLHFIGHCSGFSDHDRVELLARFEQLRTGDSFGEDARQPGGPSRWSGGKDMEWVPVQPGVVVQVSYDQPTEGRFRHATRLERWRPDKDAEDCTMDQLERPEGLGFPEIVGN